jgi:hypothetical protein
MNASRLDGSVAALLSAKGARMPSIADDDWAERRSAALRSAAGFRNGFECLNVIAQCYASRGAWSSMSDGACGVTP